MGTVGGVMKFCEALDRFVGIRSLSPDELRELFRGARFTDRKSYTRLVINAVVVGFMSEIAPLMFGNQDYPMLGDIIEGELYNLCIKVNPGLDIREVSIPMSQQAAESGIAMLEAAPARPGPEAGPAPAEGGKIVVEAGSERFLRMEDELRRAIIGQDEAIGALARAIRKAKAGLKSPDRPVGSFLFVGATGVGKTETAKALNRFLFDKTPMVRIDCSEYAAPHEYSKLIGAPPGYIGHNDGGALTEAMRSRPATVVVFDEIEKAHAKVHNLLLQVMEEGVLTDSKGAVIPFREAVLIMTSNVGVDRIGDFEGAIGFDRTERKMSHKLRSAETRKALDKAFPPEFLNRIDEIVVFRALTLRDAETILERLLGEVTTRSKNLGLTVRIEAEARAFLLEQGFDEKYGARPLRRAVHQHVENPLAEEILSGHLERGAVLVGRLDRERQTLAFARA